MRLLRTQPKRGVLYQEERCGSSTFYPAAQAAIVVVLRGSPIVETELIGSCKNRTCSPADDCLAGFIMRSLSFFHAFEIFESSQLAAKLAAVSGNQKCMSRQSGRFRIIQQTLRWLPMRQTTEREKA